MEIKTLENLSFDEIAQLFNAAFADYFVKVNLTSAYLQDKIHSEDIRLDKSVGIFSNEKPVGFILHAIRNNVAYNAGTGVIPEFRGHHATVKMYKYALEILKKEGVSKVFLEVIEENIQAIKSYKKPGFVKQRNLPGFGGKINVLNSNKQLVIKEINKPDLEYLQSFCEWKPTWQHKFETITKLNDFKIFGAYLKQTLVGYIYANVSLGRIAQFAVHPAYRQQKIATSLFQYFATIYTDELRVFNIDGGAKESQLFLKKIGLTNTITQHEMVLKIN